MNALYDLLPIKPPRDENDDPVIVPIVCDKDALNKASFDGRNYQSEMHYKLVKGDCTDHHLAKAQEKASGRFIGMKTVKRVGKYSAFKNDQI